MIGCLPYVPRLGIHLSTFCCTGRCSHHLSHPARAPGECSHPTQGARSPKAQVPSPCKEGVYLCTVLWPDTRSPVSCACHLCCPRPCSRVVSWEWTAWRSCLYLSQGSDLASLCSGLSRLLRRASLHRMLKPQGQVARLHSVRQMGRCLESTVGTEPRKDGLKLLRIAASCALGDWPCCRVQALPHAVHRARDEAAGNPAR